MKKLTRSILICGAALLAVLSARPTAAQELPASDAALFACLNLDYPGLEPVAEALCGGDTVQAKNALLLYYRNRTGIQSPDFDPAAAKPTETERRWADDGLEHRFFVHTGYQPSYFYGEDINWEYWPVQDNELRWQLHRMKWWVPMGKCYRATGDEKYAREWCFQYLDWMKKNPLVNYHDADRGAGEGSIDHTTASNAHFAWRPLEVSDRLENQILQFQLFLPAEAFDADFLAAFLVNYDRHCRHLTQNFSLAGNHLLFEAQRLLYGAIFFPELRGADEWRRTAVDILNTEIKKQVYDDGGQYELDPHYHVGVIDIFLCALRMCEVNNCADVFPPSYVETLRKMIELHYSYCFPDCTCPVFSDARLHDRAYYMPHYTKWTALFPDDEMLRYLYTDGREGRTPDYLSRAFRTSGYYALRNGWTMDATMLVLKAGPKAFWHCQPDNGTFELWHKGRQFFPDSGSYVYEGSAEINAQRRWFRQTRVHNTLTLDNRNLENTASESLRWSENLDGTDIVTVETPGYEGLTHRRTVLFVDRRFFVLLDEAIGSAEGEVELHYNLIECEPEENASQLSLRTRFEDGNNLYLRVFAPKGTEMRREEGRVSRSYRVYTERPAYAFATPKSAGETLRYVTLLMPVEGDAAAPRAEVRFDERSRTLRLKVDGKSYHFDLSEKQNN